MRELHPVGKNFNGEILTHGFSETKNHKEQVFVSIKNTETGKEITAFMSLSDKVTRSGKKVVEYTIEKLRRCGFRGYQMAELASGELLKGNEILYEVEHETYTDNNGNEVTTDKVGWINDPNGGGVERSAVAAQNASRFDALLRDNPPENKPAANTDSDPGPEYYVDSSTGTPF